MSKNDKIPCPCGKGFITREESDESFKFFQEEVRKEVDRVYLSREKWLELKSLIKDLEEVVSQ